MTKRKEILRLNGVISDDKNKQIQPIDLDLSEAWVLFKRALKAKFTGKKLQIWSITWLNHCKYNIVVHVTSKK
jgi:hypothetical protein